VSVSLQQGPSFQRQETDEWAVSDMSTRGEPGKFWDSFNFDTLGLAGYSPTLDATVIAQDKILLSLPKIQHLIMYSCSTASDADLGTSGFGITGNNRSFEGFFSPVLVGCLSVSASNGLVPLWHHTKKLIESWRTKSVVTNRVTNPLDSAVRAANTSFVPLSVNLANGQVFPIEMHLIGDPRSTLDNIYLAEGEPTTVAPNRLASWYFVYPNSRK
jgi:hypothetical protein